MTQSRRSTRKVVGQRGSKRKKKQKPTGRQRLKKVLLWLTALGLVGAILGLGAFVLLYQTVDLPDPNEEWETQTTFVYYDNGDTEVGQYAQQNRVSIPLDDMPDKLLEAVVSAENKSFWNDRGIDPRGIVRALFSNAQGNATQGASTITQQYIKILYLDSEQRITRKVKEAILSLKIQRELSKREILEGYLNTIYFGRGAYGVEAASQAYFDTSARELNVRQAATLASILNKPSSMDPANGKEARRELLGRYQYTLNRMVEDGHVPQQRAEKLKRGLPKFPEIGAQSAYGGQRGHMLKLVRDELLRLGFDEQQIDGGGLRVTTTLDQEMMTGLQEAVIEQRPEGFGDVQLHIGAATVEPGTGALKAFYGGQDYLDSQINWAATGGMVGSTMKAFTVATALKEGFSLRDTFQGYSPYRFPDGLEVNNAGEGASDMGSSVSMTTATASSTNTAFVDMSDSMENGPRKIHQLALATGVPPAQADERFPGIPARSVDLDPQDTLITLGKARISPINMANAYATFANAGERADVHVVEQVTDTSGEVLYEHESSTRRAVDEDVAADTVYALEQVVRSGSGRAAQALGRPAAGKTGTATGGQDNHVSSSWYVGFTPQLSTAVMYVRGDGDDQLDGWLPSYYGGSYPAATWTSIMQRVMEGMEVEDFPEPAFLDGDAEDTPSQPAPPPSQPSPTRTQEPRPTPTPTRTRTPSPTPTPTRTQEPEPTREPTPTEEPTPTQPPPTSQPTPTQPPPTGQPTPTQPPAGQ